MAYWLTRYADMDGAFLALATEVEPVVEQGQVIVNGEYIEFFDPEAEILIKSPQLDPGEVRRVRSITIELEE